MISRSIFPCLRPVCSKLYMKETNKSILKLMPSRFMTTEKDKNQDVIKEDKSIKGRMKLMWTKYGYLAIGMYSCLYLTTLSGIFISLDAEIFNASNVGFNPEDLIKTMCDNIESLTGNTNFPGFVRENPRAGTFIIALCVTEITEIPRIGLLLAAIPYVAKKFEKKPI